MNHGEHNVNGWFITTRDLLTGVFGTLGLMVTVIGGMYFFFSSRDTNAGIMNDRINNAVHRVDKLEDAIYGNNGLNEKFTDVQSKLSVLIGIARDDKNNNNNNNRQFNK